MIYYRYDSNGNITERSTTPLSGDNVCSYDEDFDLDLFRVVVGNVVNGMITKHTKFYKDADAVSRKIKELTDHQAEVELNIDFRLSMLELGL